MLYYRLQQWKILTKFFYNLYYIKFNYLRNRYCSKRILKKNVLIVAVSIKIYHSLTLGEESYDTLNEWVPQGTNCSHGVDWSHSISAYTFAPVPAYFILAANLFLDLRLEL